MAYIEGTTRYEVIVGTNEDDYIDCKNGNDLVRDYTNSNDTYYFDYGYGQPNFTDAGGNDTFVFAPGIKASDIKFYLSERDFLMPRIKDTNDKPEVTNWSNPRYKIERWVFDDGTILTSDQIDNLIDYNTRVLVYTTEGDIVRTGQGNNLIFLMQGDDSITTYGGNNIIEASSGNDLIYNYGSGNDEIYMGWGVDYTEDHGGDDRYIFNKGNGLDTILDLSGNDVVKFGIGITKDDLIFSREGDNLAVTLKNSPNDKLVVKDWIKLQDNNIEIFEVWDGSRITASEVEIRIGTIPTDPPPNITPTIIGTDVYDYKSGQNGDDVYYLKRGNDRVMDYTGNETYMFNKGDGNDNITDQQGNDIIFFGEGITKEDLTFRKDPNNADNLIISINNTSDSININKWFRNSAFQVEKVVFSDGSKLTNTEIEAILNPGNSKPVNITGTENNDNLSGNDLNNIIMGNKGNDTISDIFGDDTYVFNKGDGQDIITDNGGIDTIKFGANIAKTDVNFNRSGNDLVIKLNGSSDQITIKSWYSNALNKIENFTFSDNSSYNIIDAERMSLDNWSAYGYNPTVVGTDTYENKTGLGGDDIYYLKRSNDRVMDYTGNDTYLFNRGDGNDNITDQSGTDAIVFGWGINRNALTFRKDPANAENLIISINNTSDSVNINKWFRNTTFQVEKIQFMDGTSLTNADINNLIQSMTTYASPTQSQASIMSTISQNQTIQLVASYL